MDKNDSAASLVRSDALLGSDGLPWPQTFDGQTWAKEFIRHVQERPEIATDEGTMIGWFANAIMVGYDRAKQEPNNSLQRPPADGGTLKGMVRHESV